MVDNHLYYEDLLVGEVFDSPGRTVTESDVVTFCGVSGDFNELHIDEEFMKTTQFGTRIAHGLLGLAMQSGLGSHAMRGPVSTLAFLGIKEWNFKAPIYIGDTIRVRFSVSDRRVAKSGDRGVVTWKREVLNQRGEIVQDGYMTTLVRLREKSAS